MNTNIDLSYLKENSFGDVEFIIEILNTTYEEFVGLLEDLDRLKNPDQFTGEELYNLLHKYKPTVSMYKMSSYPIFKEFGSGNNLMEYEKYLKLYPIISKSIFEASLEIRKEWLFYTT